MKWVIASDIHGSAEATRKLLEHFKSEKADKLLLLGDLLYHGPRNDLPEKYGPKSVFEQLNEIKDKIVFVRGNCDAEVDQMVLEFPITADYVYLPLDDFHIFATHGHLYNLYSPPALENGDVLLCGHTHISACEEKNGFVYMNPGSTSIPKGGTPAGFMVYDSGIFTWKTLDGKTYRTYKK